MKKKIFVTRKLLKENEEKLKELFEVTLNKDDKIYKPQEIIDGSKNFEPLSRGLFVNKFMSFILA